MDKQLMRLALALLLYPLAWGAAFTSKATGNWSSAGQTTWTEVGVPGAGDTVTIQNGHTVTVDANTSVGAAGAGAYSYVMTISVAGGGSGGSGACTVTIAGGTTVNTSPATATCTLSGGAVNSVTLTSRGFYTGASAQPTCSFSATGLVGASCSLTWSQGGGVAAITEAGSGKLSLAAGVTLTAAGDIITSGSSQTADSIVFGAGSTLNLDMTSAPANAVYVIGQSADSSFRNINAACSSGSRCAITATGTGSNGKLAAITTNGYSYGMGGTFQYVDFSNLGDSKTPNTIGFNGANLTGRWEHCTFTNMGRWQVTSNGRITATAVYVLDGNKFQSPNDTTDWYMWTTYAKTTGTRTITNNVFSGAFCTSNAGCFQNATVSGNYFGDWTGVASNAANLWDDFANNLIRSGTSTLSAQLNIPAGATCANTHDAYLVVDRRLSNPHFAVAGANSAAAICGFAFGHLEYLKAGDDAGEGFDASAASSAPTSYAITKSIVLPDRKGNSHSEIGATTNTMGNDLYTVEHNTWWGGAAPGVFGGWQINENGNSAAGQLASFKSNLVVRETASPSDFHKVVTRTYANPTVDVCSPANCDYNGGYGFTAVQAACTTNCTNQGNGYGGAYSSTPGANDVNADPKLLDYKRTIELWDSAYLGHSYADWSGVATYSIGDEVSHTVAAFSWGLPVNYRYVNGTGCSGANPEPGASTDADNSWKNCWEFSSLYRIREAVYAGTTYSGGTLTISGDTTCTVGEPCGAVRAVLNWTRRGYSATVAAFQGTAHDAADIGAYPVILPSAGNPMFPLIWGW